MQTWYFSLLTVDSVWRRWRRVFAGGRSSERIPLHFLHKENHTEIIYLKRKISTLCDFSKKVHARGRHIGNSIDITRER